MAPSILVLDDEAGIVHFVTEVLQEEGCCRRMAIG
jgi:hypothetical protein